MLCDLNKDFREDVDVSEKYPKVVERLLALAEKARDELGDINHKGNQQRPAGFVSNLKPRLLLKDKSKKE